MAELEGNVSRAIQWKAVTDPQVHQWHQRGLDVSLRRPNPNSLKQSYSSCQEEVVCRAMGLDNMLRQWDGWLDGRESEVVREPRGGAGQQASHACAARSSQQQLHSTVFDSSRQHFFSLT